MKSTILAKVGAAAQRYCQSGFLCEECGLPFPSALVLGEADD